MTDEIEVRPVADFQMLKLRNFSGRGICSTQDGLIAIAFTTDGPSIDVTMTHEQAAHLAKLLQTELKA